MIFQIALSIIISILQSPCNQKALEITHLSGDFYVFTTYQTFDGQAFPANGMFVVTNKGVVIIDSPWDSAQNQPLLDNIAKRHQQKVVLCIATHSHNDRTGSLDFLRKQGVTTYTSKQTDEICKAKDENRAEFTFTKDTTFTIGNHSFQTYYPGPGHSPDNIVIWFEKERILYGGCFVKSIEAKNLGNLADANTDEWPKSIKNVQKQFKKPKYIIPGHQDWRSTKSLKHTLKLITNYELQIGN